ncbi:alpha/beta hydrolase [Microbacterium bovistercoris]|uniref:Alpha/beta hydrolase n=1 Tax=Microbacterium bovistercoris TaxID=2293570 RepID=A0A371NQM0_9MICO|nr:alpha/beta hydrolase [Microbacterium bovistercoris]REJ04430.1 alpha/beta hydrolase [Microbacterium bovistercoris]
MDIILIPGLWLEASSWDDVTPALRAAGHRVHPLTMPGVGAPASDIGLDDWVGHVTARIDDVDGPTALVGHSGGGDVAWLATDARPDRIDRLVLVDALPPAADERVNEFPVVDGVIPFPGWESFSAADLRDLDAPTRERIVREMAPIPERIPGDSIVLSDRRRFSVPVTVLAGGEDLEELEAALADWPAYDKEFHAIEDISVVTIGSGHWPQFTVPDRLAQLILAAIA